MKLKKKVVFLLLVVSIIPLLALSFISYRIAREILMNQIGNQVEKLGFEIDEKIYLHFKELENSSNKIAENKDFLLWAEHCDDKKVDVTFLNEIFNINFIHFLNKNKNFINILYYNKFNNLIYSSQNDKSFIPDYIISNLNFKKNSEPITVYGKNGEPSIFILKKILFENNYYGSLFFKINMESIDILIKSIKLQGIKYLNIIIADNNRIISPFSDYMVNEKRSNYNTDSKQKISGINLDLLAPGKFIEKRIGNQNNFFYKKKLNKFNWSAIVILQKEELLKPISKLKITAAILTIIACFITIILSLALSNNLVKPIVSLTNSAVKISSGNFDEKISVQSNKLNSPCNDDEIMILGDSFETMRINIKEHIEHLDSKVIERTQAITDLLDNAGQGFLSFDISLTVMKEYSAQCLQIFGKKIENMNILELLFPHQWEQYLFDYASLRHDSEIVIAEDTFKFCIENEKEVMLKLLPNEIKIDKKILSVKYVFLKHQDNSKNRIMLILTDITNEKHLEKKAAEEEERNKFIVKVALDKNSFVFFIKDSSNLITRMRSFVNDGKFDILNLTYIYRDCHTIKGNASFFNMRKVVETTHRFENYLEEIKLTSIIPNNVIDDVNKNIENIYIYLNEYLDLVKDFLNRDEILKDEKIFEVTETRINNLVNYVINKNITETDKKYIISKINELKKISIKYILKRFVLNAQQLAVKLGKIKGQINLINEDLPVDYYYLKPAIDSFVHLIRNAVDHGIEPVSLRKRLNKPAEFKLEMSIDEKIIDDKIYFIFKISDDGQGIDLKKLKQKVIEKKIKTAEEISSISENELINLIFLDGISSKEISTEISGRGVGLSAVKAAVESLNGKIEIQTVQGKSTCFTVFIPYLKTV
ncbi:hypothetical protein KA977_08310 [Candidatus Dependentiae bacterium]|nr:hypothetical protein [Candidatus Dependentiae bacterium]